MCQRCWEWRYIRLLVIVFVDRKIYSLAPAMLKKEPTCIRAHGWLLVKIKGKEGKSNILKIEFSKIYDDKVADQKLHKSHTNRANQSNYFI